MMATFKLIRMAAITVALGFGMLDAQTQQKPVDPDKAPKWNPGFTDQVPNRELSGNTPATNSSLQADRNGNMGSEYFGWLGLIGLAGLFGLSRGTNPAPVPAHEIRERPKHDA